MNSYWKAVCAAIVGVVLCLILSKNAKDHSTLVAVLLCSILCAAACAFLAPVLKMLDKLSALSAAGTQWLGILLKCVGLSFVGETVSTICADAGNGAVGKSLQLLTTVTILWVSLPLIENLLDLIESVLELL